MALRVLSLNVSFYSRNYGDVLELIDRLRPDVAGLVEVNTQWIEMLAPLDDVYVHRAVYLRRRGSGVALLSQIPLEDAEVRRFPGLGQHYALGTVRLGEHRVTLATAHAANPLTGRSRVTVRDRQFETLASVRRAFADREVMLIGDFNSSPWSLPFERLLDTTGLRTAAAGFGYQPTWPAQRPWLGIPIDHHLVSNGLAVLRFETVGPTGSDHLAVYTELGFR